LGVKGTSEWGRREDQTFSENPGKGEKKHRHQGHHVLTREGCAAKKVKNVNGFVPSIGDSKGSTKRKKN